MKKTKTRKIIRIEGACKKCGTEFIIKVPLKSFAGKEPNVEGEDCFICGALTESLKITKQEETTHEF
jgi:hypothetical protein